MVVPRPDFTCPEAWRGAILTGRVRDKGNAVEPLRILFMENNTMTRARLHWVTALLVVLLLGSPLPAQVRVTPSVVPRVASSAADSSGFWLYFA